jgi:hypothetical protein
MWSFPTVKLAAPLLLITLLCCPELVPTQGMHNNDATLRCSRASYTTDDVSIIGDVRRPNFIALLSRRDEVIAVVSCDRHEQTAFLQ